MMPVLRVTLTGPLEVSVKGDILKFVQYNRVRSTPTVVLLQQEHFIQEYACRLPCVNWY